MLVVAEFALALILVAGAGLILRSFWNVTQVDLGIARITFSRLACQSSTSAPPPAEQIRAVYAQLQERIAAVPGVLKVAIAPGLPANGAGRLHFAIVGQSSEEDVTDNRKRFSCR